MVRLSSLVALLVVFLGPVAAGAQSRDEHAGFFAAPTDGARGGFTFGASIGPSKLQISCPGCSLEPLDQGLSLSAHAGAVLTTRLALVVEHWRVVWEGRDNYWFGSSTRYVVQEQFNTVGAQLWLTKRFWLRGGVGVSRHKSDVSYASIADGGNPGLRSVAGGEVPPRPLDHTRKAPALTAAAGMELVYTPTFAVDLALRVGTGSAGDRGIETTAGAFTIGATWY